MEGVTPVFVYCPMLAALDLEDGKPLEGIGVTPDIEVQLDPQAWNKGKGPDSQLDRAIDSAAAETNPHIVMVLDLGGIHTTDFLNQNSFSKEPSQQIQTWIKAFLGL